MAYTAEAAIEAAAEEIGYRESGTNYTKFNRWLGSIPGYPHGGLGYPWCASFLSWVAAQAGARPGTDAPRTAGCAASVSWFRARGRWHSTPRAGDWVHYGPGGGTHVELVTAVTSSSITTIGGNTSGSLNGTYHNGDGVYRKTVSRSEDRIYGYGRPAYATKEDDDMPSPKDLWEWDGIPAPDGSKTNPNWKAASHLTDLGQRLRRVEAAVAKIAGQRPDVDEDAIVAGVLSGLTPERIAAAIPPEIAEQVVTALGTRLNTPKEG